MFKKITVSLSILMLLLCVVLPGTLSVSAATSGDYTYSVSGGEATITDYSGAGGDVTIPSTLGGYPVTSIGGYAFSSCNSLTSVTIPDSVTSIGKGVFKGCTNLESITLPFIGSSRTASGTYDAVLGYIFGYTSSNESGTTKQYYSTGSSYYYFIPSSLKSVTITDATQIPYGAFYNCSNLTSIMIPDSVTRIRDYAFCDCTGLAEIIIPNRVTSIGNHAFYSCDSLTSVTIGSSVTSIGEYAFEDCNSLTSVTIPDSVTSIGKGVFKGCTNLESITLPFIGSSRTASGTYDAVLGYIFGYTSFNENGTTKQYYSDYYNDYNDYYYYIPSSLKSVTITDATQIPYGAFYNCSNFTSITIPDSVTSIGERAFSGCDGLTSITIPDGVTSIGYRTFSYCSSLTSITIPAGLTSIGDYAFEYCSGLTSVTYTGTCAQAREIRIGNHNQSLTNAAWSCQNTKLEDHVYDKVCETTCNVCGYEREIEHTYTRNEEHTCEVCGHSRTPHAPTLKDKCSGQIEVVSIEGMEYSLNGTTWQSSPLFTGLEGNATYTVYQRVKASAVADESGISEPLTVTLKASQQTPAAPLVLQYTDTTVMLMAVAGCEYSLDGVQWQSGTQFIGLSPNTTYTVYQRAAGTATAEPSLAAARTVTTDRSVQTQIPPMPTVASVTANSVTLNAVDGCEYSKNGTTWQSSPTFTGLSCGTAYTFYQRYAKTDTAYAGGASVGLIASTDKGMPSTPSAPTLLSKTYRTVTLTATSGYEYSMDGVNWQASPTFTGLNASTNYVFFRRKAETAQYYASAASAPLTVRTADTPVCAEVGHTYQNDCDAICDICGEIRTVSGHVYDNACDSDCNACGEARTVPEHSYTDVSDTTCNICGEIRVIMNDGWVLDGSDWFYYINGEKATGWQYVNDNWYYLNSAGVMQTGWQYVNNTWYYLNEGGAMTTGWQLIGGTWYYMNEGGAMTTGWQYIGSTWYYMNEGGAMTTGWQYIGNTWYYMNEGGAMTTGWQYIGNTWYYMNEGGAMTTGWQCIGGTWYYMNEGGAMQTGWLNLGGTWYFLNDSGAMQTGWQMIGGVWYYFYDSGAMATNCWIGNYWINAGGVWVA